MNINIKYENNDVRFTFNDIKDMSLLGKVLFDITSGVYAKNMVTDLLDQLGPEKFDIVIDTMARLKNNNHNNTGSYIKPSEFTRKMMSRGKNE